MRVRRRALSLVVASASLSPAASAEPWRSARASRVLVAPWRQCAELRDALEGDAFAHTVLARPAKAGVDVLLAEDGDGRWGSHFEQHLRLEHGSCAKTSYDLEGLKEGLVFGLF